jgi:hypothetical protein
VTVPGETEHVASAGAPVQAKETGCLKPFSGASVREKLALRPTTTDALEGEPELIERVKSGGTPYPAKLTVCVPSLSETFKVADSFPPIEGAKRTRMPHDPPTEATEVIIWQFVPTPDRASSKSPASVPDNQMLLRFSVVFV